MLASIILNRFLIDLTKCISACVPIMSLLGNGEFNRLDAYPSPLLKAEVDHSIVANQVYQCLFQ
jgi:hypothetical protein